MKKLNVKNLLVKGVIPVTMALVMSGCGAPSKTVESWYDKDSTMVEEKTDIDATPETEKEMIVGSSKEIEALETLESLFVNDYVQSGTSANWDKSQFTCEMEAELWNFIDDNFLSKYDYTSVMNVNMLTDLDSEDSIPRAFRHQPGIIYILKGLEEGNDGKTMEKMGGAIVTRFDENGRIGFEYLYLNDEKDIADSENNTACVRYSPYGGYLVIANANNQESAASEKYVYEVPEEKNIEMINQLFSLYNNQATVDEIFNNIDSIANANYNVNFDYTSEEHNNFVEEKEEEVQEVEKSPEEKRSEEALRTLKLLLGLPDKEEELSKHWDYNFYNDPAFRSIWASIDNNVLSNQPYSKRTDTVTVCHVLNEKIDWIRSIAARSTKYSNHNSLIFYADEGSHETHLSDLHNFQRFRVDFENGTPVFSYQAGAPNEKIKGLGNLESPVVHVRYYPTRRELYIRYDAYYGPDGPETPSCGMLTDLDRYVHSLFVMEYDQDLEVYRSLNSEMMGRCYSIPEDKNVDMVTQLYVLAKLQITPSAIFDNMESISNANYHVNPDYISMLHSYFTEEEKQEEVQEQTQVEETNQEEIQEQVQVEETNQGEVQEQAQVEETNQEETPEETHERELLEITQKLNFKNTTFAGLVPRLVDGALINPIVDYDNRSIFTITVEGDLLETILISAKENGTVGTFEELSLSHSSSFDEGVDSFTHTWYQNSNTEEYEICMNTDGRISFITYNPAKETLTIDNFQTDNFQTFKVPSRMKDVMVSQMINDYYERADYDEVVEDLLNVQKGNTQQNLTSYEEVLNQILAIPQQETEKVYAK